HVRKAMNYAIARSSLLPSFEKAGTGAAAITHVGLDSEENNLLLNFDPFRASTGDLQAARDEMSQSKYDSDHDGTCDAAVCRVLRLLVPGGEDGRVEAAKEVAAQLAGIGMQVRAEVQNGDTFYSTYRDPRVH